VAHAARLARVTASCAGADAIFGLPLAIGIGVLVAILMFIRSNIAADSSDCPRRPSLRWCVPRPS
jgi:hypothetical protein